jgi:hypothetical protein
MRKVRKFVGTLAGLAMMTGLSFGAPVHWPKLHHKAKQDQSTETTKTPKQKKSHHLFHHAKKSQKPADSNPQ